MRLRRASQDLAHLEERFPCNPSFSSELCIETVLHLEAGREDNCVHLISLAGWLGTSVSPCPRGEESVAPLGCQ